MPRIDIDSNFGQVAQTIENHYSGGRQPPPEGHPHARRCPQCQGDAWRMTQWCVHCGADLFAFDRHERQRRLALRKTGTISAALLLSGASWWVQPYLPSAWKLWVMGFGIFAMLVAVAVTKE